MHWLCVPVHACGRATAVLKFNRTAVLWQDFAKFDTNSWSPMIGDGADYEIPGGCHAMAERCRAAYTRMASGLTAPHGP